MPGAPSVHPLPDSKKNILITSALPYVNAVPHLGNIIGCVLSADVAARFRRGRSEERVLFVCGTDEYGTTTETVAIKEGLSPKAICDKYHALHAQVYRWFDISFDIFGRTTDDAHVPIAQEIFKGVHEHGLLEQRDLQQLYCVACQKFLADRFVEGTCPLCGFEDARGDQCDGCGHLMDSMTLIRPRCKEHGTTPEERTARHLFFDLSKMQGRLEAFAEESAATGVWSSNAVAITRNWLKKGLEPRCVTRDFKWGCPCPVPGFEHLSIYNWIDAPIGYISITAQAMPDTWRRWWHNPKEVELHQFMGKDNTPFHTILFPATLLGADQGHTMLHSLSTTEFLQWTNGKFSKSRGCGLFGDSVAETGIPSDVWRFYLLSGRPESSDTTFSWADLMARTNNLLLANFGNFANRALKFCASRFGAKVPSLDKDSPVGESEEALVRDVNAELAVYVDLLERDQIREGAASAMRISSLGNTYMQDNKPWDLLKKGEDARARVVIVHAIAVTKLLANVLEPYVPAIATKIAGYLRLEGGVVPGLPSSPVFEVESVQGREMEENVEPLVAKLQQKHIDELEARYSGKPMTEEEAAAAAAPKAKAKKSRGGKNKKKAPVEPLEVPEGKFPLDLRVGRIVGATPHEAADRLYVLTVDVGKEKPRTIVSGIRAAYPSADADLLGRRVVTLLNLPEATFKGVASEGMLIAAEDAAGVQLLSVPGEVEVGSRIVPAGRTIDDHWLAEHPFDVRAHWDALRLRVTKDHKVAAGDDLLVVQDGEAAGKAVESWCRSTALVK